ncbi:MAG: TIGR04086 family membrane protein [Firmicutes bacterium]|nr:TIGR04086 family membrane protein [Bacillota bacterium]
MKSKMASEGNKAIVLDILRSTLIAVIASLIVVLVLALIVKLTGMGEGAILPINQVLKVLSVLVGCLFGIKDRSKGAFKGASAGLLYAVVSIFVFLVLKNSLSGNSFSFIDLIANTATGAVSGIISVNFRKK